MLLFGAMVAIACSDSESETGNTGDEMCIRDRLNIANGAIAYQKQVDVAEYISWVDGGMLLNGNDLSHIIQKLSIYYGIPIQCDPMVGKEKVYGKLDLKR